MNRLSKSLSILALMCACLPSSVFSQGVGINITGTPPHPSSALDIDMPNKGTLLSRMTTSERNSIESPAEGLMIFNTITKCFEFYAFGVWQTLGCAECPTVPEPVAGSHIPQGDQIQWVWNEVEGAIGYKWNTTNNYQSATDVGLNLSHTQTGLSCGLGYALYVWAYTGCGRSEPTTLNQSTSPCPCADGTGGVITHVNGQTIHTFNSSGTFIPPCATEVQVLVVGGGGGGCGGGGGGGGVIYNAAYSVNAEPYSVTVGNGGGVNTNGGNSVFDAITALGGGGGGCQTIGKPGGSGGGGGQVSSYSGGAGNAGQGFAGGNTTHTGFPYPGSGGGGAGGAGQNSQNNSTAGNGGIGVQHSISGTPVYYGGGGGGGLWNTGGTPGSGGNGGGGTGNSGGTGGAGAANRGGGGGGGGQTVGGVGGSGVVIISYPTP